MDCEILSHNYSKTPSEKNRFQKLSLKKITGSCPSRRRRGTGRQAPEGIPTQRSICHSLSPVRSIDSVSTPPFVTKARPKYVNNTSSLLLFSNDTTNNTPNIVVSEYFPSSIKESCKKRSMTFSTPKKLDTSYNVFCSDNNESNILKNVIELEISNEELKHSKKETFNDEIIPTKTGNGKDDSLQMFNLDNISGALPCSENAKETESNLSPSTANIMDHLYGEVWKNTPGLFRKTKTKLLSDPVTEWEDDLVNKLNSLELYVKALTDAKTKKPVQSSIKRYFKSSTKDSNSHDITKLENGVLLPKMLVFDDLIEQNYPEGHNNSDNQNKSDLIPCPKMDESNSSLIVQKLRRNRLLSSDTSCDDIDLKLKECVYNVSSDFEDEVICVKDVKDNDVICINDIAINNDVIYIADENRDLKNKQINEFNIDNKIYVIPDIDINTNIKKKLTTSKKTTNKELAVNVEKEVESDKENDKEKGVIKINKKNLKEKITGQPKDVLKKSVSDNVITKQIEIYSFMASLADTVPSWRCNKEAKLFKDNFKSKKEELTKRLFHMFNENVYSSQLHADLPIVWSSSLTTTAGRAFNKMVKSKTSNVTRRSTIELSSKVLDTAQRLRDTLAHELCHAAAWLVDGQLRDGHGPYWKAWVAKTLKHYPELVAIPVCHSLDIHFKYTYKCVKCGYSIDRHSKSIDTTKKRCGYCYGNLECIHNKKNKDGVIVSTRVKERQPTGFALYVKENYGMVRGSNTPHKDTMKYLGKQYAKMKLGVQLGQDKD